MHKPQHSYGKTVVVAICNDCNWTCSNPTTFRPLSRDHCTATGHTIRYIVSFEGVFMPKVKPHAK